MNVLVIDFARVLIFADVDVPSLGRYHDELSANPSYRVFDHFSLNLALIERLHQLRPRISVFLFTDGELHTAPAIVPALQGVFTAIVTAEELGLKKSLPASFLALAHRLGFAPSTAALIDDNPANVAAAHSAGYMAHCFRTNEEAFNFLNSVFDGQAR
jgi:FMN phosphatase YigB (HAD superfamily)